MRKEKTAGLAVIRVVAGTKTDSALLGFMGMRRKAPTGYGGLCFPGGYAHHGESTLEAAKRETLEELGVRPEGTWSLVTTKRVPGEVRIDFWMLNAPWEGTMLHRLQPCPREVLGVQILTPADRLVFPAQQEVFSHLVASC